MGMWRAFYPQCDECMEIFESEYADFWAANVRKAMKEDGWQVGKKLVCPNCLGANNDDSE